ncbi:hypothetical protein HN51_010559 [Arachis hypogaea]|uniref:Transmembrane protein n=1 Tax=Arachis hypogaea TaxID=3818 RepID=A0A445E2X9_ARAHY|nr:hypothetical protein Ahy_A03g016262 isoform C [Arachis hypogaea]
MAYGDRNRGSSVFDGFTLSPLPYPVLLILALILIFLGVSWYFSYEEVVESAQVQLGWLLFATPVLLILIVRWLSSMENTEWFSGWDRRRRTTQGSLEGSSPWGVAALIVVLLILMQYQSIFRDNCVEGAFYSNIRIFWGQEWFKLQSIYDNKSTKATSCAKWLHSKETLQLVILLVENEIPEMGKP